MYPVNEINPYAPPVEAESTGGESPALDPPQTVSFRLIAEDHLAAAKCTALKIPEFVRPRRRMIRYAALGSLGFLSAGSVLAINDNDFSGFLFMYGAMALVFAISGGFLAGKSAKDRVRALIKRNIVPITDDCISCTIETDGVRIEEPGLATAFAWRKVLYLHSTPDHLFLYLTPQSPVIIPMKGFASERRFQAYCRLAERLWEALREPTVAPS